MVPWVRHKTTCFTVCYLQCLPLLHWKLTAVPGNEVITAAVESVRPWWEWISDQTRQSLFLFSQGQNKQTTTTRKTAVHWFMSCRWLTCHRLVAEVVVAVVGAKKKNRQVKTTQVSTKCTKYVEKYNVGVYLGKADCIKVWETKVLLKNKELTVNLIEFLAGMDRNVSWPVKKRKVYLHCLLYVRFIHALVS